MTHNIVKTYIEDILTTQLTQAGLSKQQTELITSDISDRLKSILAIWSNSEYLNTLFESVKEEALFYKPKSHVSIRSLVVFCIRNSNIEDVHSSSPLYPDLKVKEGHYVKTSEFIQDITSKAIVFFSGLSHLLPSLSKEYEHHLFIHLDEKYPRAWAVLSNSALPENTDHLPKPKLLDEVKKSRRNKRKLISSVVSGIDHRLDKGLESYLKQIIDNPENSCFFIPSFKNLSRNIEKLLSVFELLAYLNVPIVTLNYYIESGKTSVRDTMLRPMHELGELKEQISNFDGLTQQHAEQLKNIAKNLM